MPTGGLSKFAAKGERQKLDRDWTKLLHQEGLSPFLPIASVAPAKLGQAIREFNRAQYWRCHETLEELWLPERHNLHGGTVKLQDAQYALTPFSPRFMGVEIGNLLSEISNRLVYCQDAGGADRYAIDQLTPVHIHFEQP